MKILIKHLLCYFKGHRYVIGLNLKGETTELCKYCMSLKEGFKAIDDIQAFIG